ncbi:phosphonate ABC transporter substrate-binding protein [Alkalimonas sp. MEB108]|uniref:Phosphonate ABC transporter substrate-binding protein n=1 Tax=Alkalimonas cellulosilytica TaxID=3058395 RepID=A0ABU7J6X1_9GAMM|nr:phosphonate ABC transporter substrate-binding protein [Alkalimonas sp. MEB108]MEE2002102.1 phosphonate ABC transporter substrate-binding protein [Alkalimonas sp. MEB108]
MLGTITRLLVLAVSILMIASVQAQYTFGVIPAENNEEAAARFEPLRKDLEEQLGKRVRVFFATDYAGIIEAMRRGRVDFAWFGATSGLLAHREAGAVPFAVGVSRETGSAEYYSHFIVRADSPAQTLEDLRGKNIAFVDPASTSGGVVPTYEVLKHTGQMPEDFFGRLQFAGTHDASVMAVRNGSVDAGVVGDFLFDAMVARGLISRDEFRVILASDPVPGPPMMIRAALGEELKARLTEIITTVHERVDGPIHMGNMSHYRATDLSEYKGIQEMMDMGLL